MDLSLVLRNINSRIRYNGLSSKEMLLQRDMLTNNTINIDDKLLIQKQAQNKAKSSLYSQKLKLRTLSKTEEQNFEIGQLVFLRNAVDKNNPRELYMIEDTEENNQRRYLLIRKLRPTLRERLYRTLPEELILAPGQDNKTKYLQPKNPTPQDKKKDNYGNIDNNQPLNRAGRPLRKAAQRANDAISLAINSVTKRKLKSRHGWEYEDQQSDTECTYSLCYSHFSTMDDTDSTTLSSNVTESLDGSNTLVLDMEQNMDMQEENTSETDVTNLSWDCSPEQYRLLEDQTIEEELSEAVQPRQLFPFPIQGTDDEILEDARQVEPKPKRQRRAAISENIVTRSNAFRDHSTPLNAGYLPSPEETEAVQQNLEDAIQNVSGQLLDLVDSHCDDHCLQITEPPNRSSTPRIPHPISPNKVKLNMVNDISTVVQRAFPTPHTNDVIPPPEATHTRNRRNIRQPTNYRKFHHMGQF